MSNLVSRFRFPTFQVVRTEDTSTHEVEIGTVNDGGQVFVVTMLRNKQYPGDNFLVASVDDAQGKNLWKFDKSYDGVGVLAKAGSITVVALTSKGKEGKVERVIPFSTFYGDKPDLRRLAALKKTAAEFLGRKCVMSHAEEILLRVDSQRRHETEETAARAAEEARVRARAQRVAIMLARPTLTGFTADNRRRQGVPVTESEWPSLPHGTYVILVDSIDADGKIGKLLEAFSVLKEEGRNPKKQFAKPVTAQPTHIERSVPAITPTRSTVIETSEGAYEVQLYRNMDEIRAARAAGLNGGTYVAIERQAGLKIEVFSVHKDALKTIGNFVPLG